jgi:hypothetical protein
MIAVFLLLTLRCRVVPEIPDEQRISPNADPKPASYVVPLQEATDAQLLVDQSNLAGDCLDHHHTNRCKKGGCLGTDLSCNVTMPRPTVDAHTIVTSSGALLAKCNKSSIAPYIPAVLLATPCNMAIWLSCEVSTWWRDWHLWALGKAHNHTEAPPPECAPIAVQAAQQAEYSVKYSTKNDAVNISTPIMETAARMLDKAHKALQRQAGESNPPAFLLSGLLACLAVALFGTETSD